MKKNISNEKGKNKNYYSNNNNHNNIPIQNNINQRHNNYISNKIERNINLEQNGFNSEETIIKNVANLGIKKQLLSTFNKTRVIARNSSGVF